MKLPEIAEEGKRVRITFSVPYEDAELLKEYRTFYKIIYGKEITEKKLIAHILKYQMTSDKAFMDYIAERLGMNKTRKKN